MWASGALGFRSARLSWLWGLSALGLCAVGCGSSPRFYGLSLRVSGDHNGWRDDESAPLLRWDSEDRLYRGWVDLPGRDVALRLSAPRTEVWIGAVPGAADAESALVTAPATLSTSAFSVEEVRWLQPIHVATPLSARYELTFEPHSGQLRVDLAPEAERDQPVGAGLLIAALRGADKLPVGEQAQRLQALRQALSEQGIETPLASYLGSPERGKAWTFLDWDAAPARTVSVLGDWNRYEPGVDRMLPALSGRLRLRAMPVLATRAEYLIDRDGSRRVDPLNYELAWSGEKLQPNPHNLLGGNVGELHSVAMAPGLTESGPRLRRLPLPLGSLSELGLGEVLVQLPAGYAQRSMVQFPSVYIHDGKDALVRGRYDRLLFALAENGQVPPTVAVFLPAPDTATARLSLYAHYKDPRFPEVTPRGAEYARHILDVVVPAVEKAYRAGTPRTMLGIDMAGPFSFELAWSDPQRRFARLVSQSGRFGWGEDASGGERPYARTLSADRSPQIERLAFDWSDGDLYQVQVHDSLRPLFAGPGYTGKVQFNRQLDPGMEFWESLRLRAQASLGHVLSDIVSPTGKTRN
jgi:hypothetical protein